MLCALGCVFGVAGWRNVVKGGQRITLSLVFIGRGGVVMQALQLGLISG